VAIGTTTTTTALETITNRQQIDRAELYAIHVASLDILLGIVRMEVTTTMPITIDLRPQVITAATAALIMVTIPMQPKPLALMDNN